MYTPEYRGPIEGYVVNQLKTKQWRVARLHDREDMLQESYLVFLRCAARYPLLDAPEHFMALFKTAWSRHMIDLAKKATKANVEIPEYEQSPEDGAEWLHEHAGELENAGHLAVMVQQAPREVMMVLNLFLNAPQELLDLAAAAWVKQGHRFPHGNMMINKMLGLPAEADPIGEVHNYFNK